MSAKPPSRRPSSGRGSARRGPKRGGASGSGGGRSSRSGGTGRDDRVARPPARRRGACPAVLGWRRPAWRLAAGPTRRRTGRSALPGCRVGSFGPASGRRPGSRHRVPGTTPDRGRDDGRDRDGTRHDQDRPWEHTDLEPPEPEEWILEGIEQEAEGAVRRGGSPRRARGETNPKRRPGPSRPRGRGHPRPSTTRSPCRAHRTQRSTRPWARTGWGTARRPSEGGITGVQAGALRRGPQVLRPLAREAPGVSEVRELSA